LGAVGKPLPGVITKIINTQGEHLNPGDIGEIIYKCPAVCPGYLNNDNEEKEIFRNGWIYTGDLGYLDDDGFLFIVDRKKRIILIQALIVYPSRIEEAFSELGIFKEVACFGVDDEHTGEAIALFYSCETEIPKEILLERIGSRIREYERPKYFKRVDSLPRTSALKINYGEMNEILTKQIAEGKKI
jgi:acyl-CoA synthetase (AMP-forming)/AMP-acid ligase II